MVFSLGKIFLSDKEIILLERYNAPSCAKTGTSDVALQYKLSHFVTSQKPNKASLMNVIYKLMYL